MLKPLTITTLIALTTLMGCNSSTVDKVEEPATEVIEQELLVATLQGPSGEHEKDGIKLIVGSDVSIIKVYETRSLIQFNLLNSSGSESSFTAKQVRIYIGETDEDGVLFDLTPASLNPVDAIAIDLTLELPSNEVLEATGPWGIDIIGDSPTNTSLIFPLWIKS